VAVIAVSLVYFVGAAIRGVPPDPIAVARLSKTDLISFLASLVSTIVMHTMAEGLHGSTLGKRIRGLTVVSEDGSPASVRAALKRAIACLWDGMFFGLVAAQKMSESPRRQRYGDAWAETQVVRISALSPERRRPWIRFLLANVTAFGIATLLVFIEMAFRLA
jgi:uncharacterized RDD family membrane protein YckC